MTESRRRWLPVVAIISSRFIMDESFKVIEISGIVLIGTGLGLFSLISWLNARSVIKRRGWIRT